MDIVDSFWLNYDYFSITRIFVPFVANYIYHVSCLNSIMWGIILRYIASRFQQINEHLENLIKDDIKYTRHESLILGEEYQQRINFHKIKERRKFMWIIMHVHLQLCLISRDLNKIFSVQMTLQMMSIFIFVINNCCIIYTSLLTNATTFGQVLDRSFNYFWTIVHNIKFLTLNYICQIVSEQATEAIVILYKLSNSSLDKDLREQALQFVLQIKQREVQFYGMRLFYFGNNFIRRFYTSVATVVVIIIQMHITYTYDDINTSTNTVKSK
ncbi:putative gustatory receptor 28a [Linepithema humile]|uniref:putative gustatory receptor 28a n=1 Tax=Linepithema humile TaxID=83485 RepID=UPI00351E9740